MSPESLAANPKLLAIFQNSLQEAVVRAAGDAPTVFRYVTPLTLNVWTVDESSAAGSFRTEVETIDRQIGPAYGVSMTRSPASTPTGSRPICSKSGR